jgi:hypothetical protein
MIQDPWSFLWWHFQRPKGEGGKSWLYVCVFGEEFKRMATREWMTRGIGCGDEKEKDDGKGVMRLGCEYHV